MVDDGDGYQRPPSFLYLFSYSSCLQLFYPRDIMQYTLTRHLFFPFHLIKTKPSFLFSRQRSKAFVSTLSPHLEYNYWVGN